MNNGLRHKPLMHRAMSLMPVVCLVAALAALLLPSLHVGFLSDDYLDLHHGFGPRTFTRFEAGGFRPLTVAVWAFDSHFWGPTHPAGWHATNLALHALNVLLIYLFLRTTGFGRRPSFWGTLLAAVSWAAVPCAARVSGRTTMIALTPMLGALIMYGRCLRGGRGLLAALAGILFLASLFAKETMLLCAPLFGFLALRIRREDGRAWRLFLHGTALFLTPTAAYATWRLAWLGPVLSYGESRTIGPFMLRNLALLARMPFSPWLDGVPARLLLLAGVLVLVAARADSRARAFMAAMIVLPLSTVLNLPPRSDFAYAALPGAALLTACMAGGMRAGWRSAVILSVIASGSFLASRDEVGRLRDAGALASEEIRRLAALDQENPGGETIFVTGLESGRAGYGTLWPGAYEEALETVGLSCDRFHDPVSLWEMLYPEIEGGTCREVLFARMSTSSTIRFDARSRDWTTRPRRPVLICSLGLRILALPDSLTAFNSCRIWPAGPGTAILLQDPFEPCSLVALEASGVCSDTAVFDLESRFEWLLRDGTRPLVGVAGTRDQVTVEFTSDRIWLGALGRRLVEKAGNLRAAL